MTGGHWFVSFEQSPFCVNDCFEFCFINYLSNGYAGGGVFLLGKVILGKSYHGSSFAIIMTHIVSFWSCIYSGMCIFDWLPSF